MGLAGLFPPKHWVIHNSRFHLLTLAALHPVWIGPGQSTLASTANERRVLSGTFPLELRITHRFLFLPRATHCVVFPKAFTSVAIKYARKEKNKLSKISFVSYFLRKQAIALGVTLDYPGCMFWGLDFCARYWCKMLRITDINAFHKTQ